MKRSAMVLLAALVLLWPGLLAAQPTDDDFDLHFTPEDCDDNNPLVHPGFAELCDGLDNNCDGVVDEDFDQDGDGFTDGCGGLICEDPLDPSTCVPAPYDCDDNNAAIYPEAPEICDGRDSDCDNQYSADELDRDQDGYFGCDPDGDPATLDFDCDDLRGTVHPGALEDCGNGLDENCDGIDGGGDSDLDGVGICDGDCDDDDTATYPGAPELCDGRDNDCNGWIDEPWDQDGDRVVGNYADCSGPDCDDDNSAISPLRREICIGFGVGVDENCDGRIDEDVDDDNDGHMTCSGPLVDCDDQNRTVNLNSPEVCDSIDNDCDGLVDEGFDSDGDGYPSCAGDCNESTAAVHVGALELCDGIDNDCDGIADEGLDLDGDHFCGPDPDCEPNNPDIYPGQKEICDLVDNNFDGAVDEGFDADHDGFSTCAGDCDDRPLFGELNFPGSVEKCADREDNDCNGLVDVDDPSCEGARKLDSYFGFSCSSAPPVRRPWGVLLLLVFMPAMMRAGRWRIASISLLLLLLVAPVSGFAQDGDDDPPEAGGDLVLYVAEGASLGMSEVPVQLQGRGIEIDDQVHALADWLLEHTGPISVAGSIQPIPCDKDRIAIEPLVRTGVSAADNLRYAEAIVSLGDAAESLQCAADPVDVDTLTRLFVYLGYCYVMDGQPRRAVEAYGRALAIRPDLRWQSSMAPKARPLFDAVQRMLIGSVRTDSMADVEFELVDVQTKKLIDELAQEGDSAQGVKLESRVVVRDAHMLWIDGRGGEPEEGGAPLQLLPGLHLVQFTTPDLSVDSLLLAFEDADAVELVGLNRRVLELLQADESADAAERAWGWLDEGLASMPEAPAGVVVLDLRGEPALGEAEALRFDRRSRTLQRIRTLKEIRNTKLKPYRSDRIRIAAVGGMAYIHPKIFGSVGAEAMVALIRPVFLDIGVGIRATDTNSDGSVRGSWFPQLSVGVAAMLGDDYVRPGISLRFGMQPEAPLPEQVFFSPSVELSLVTDIALGGESPVFVRVRVRGGIEGHRWLTKGQQITNMVAAPSAGLELGVGWRNVRGVAKTKAVAQLIRRSADP